MPQPFDPDPSPDAPRAAACRPGGRSARVQAAVHAAVRVLQADGRELSVPAIAAEAGVTPSTIYRRWGTPAQLLSDVALERMAADLPFPDTGALATDLAAWLEPYVEEMTSTPGRALIRDLVGGALPGNAAQCFAVTCQYIECMLDRARARGERTPAVDQIRDRLLAPIIYRTLFTPDPPDVAEAHAMLDGVLRDAAPGDR